MTYQYTCLILLTFLVGCSNHADPDKEIPISLDKFADGIHHYELFAEELDYPRLDTSNYRGIADNLVTFQNEDGGWPKNIDWLADVDMDSLKNTLSPRDVQSTFDNDNTHPQIDFLARMYSRTGNEKYRESAEEGLRYILETQNPSGGWRGWDVDAITFNDNVMTGIMEVLLDVKTGKSYYEWVEPELRRELNQAFDEALDVTLRCQIEVNGVKKAWGQQHDHQTLEPVQGRTYEFPAVVSRESVGVVEFLMQINNPDERIVEAVDAAVSWMRRSGLENIRIDTIHISPDTYPGQNLDVDRKVTIDSSASTIWARYYEVEGNTPFFATRSGEKVYSLAEVNPERRGGYAWYGYWPAELIEEKYPAWKKREGLK
ncbi:pectate lyase, PelA/Pel-15E family [Gracilimonas mengyeensis]|uniref:Pectate lyase, PelA/Pel-15E family n=2 Tax=Gracilimonas mengyeensis TaxID=1302730 RepID=A0A521C469_9BACT|nr:pectate lyase, PelA/Pel-15E family [Gracilimonas mengyeensis]